MDADILDMARHWYGYGRWEAKYWFIGPEPGQPEGDNVEGDNVRARCKAWIELGRGELVDCKDHHFGFGWKEWHKENPPTQPTWRGLIRLLWATKNGTQPTLDDIRSYQRNHWGMKNDETCVIELSSLAAPNLDAAGHHLLFLEERIKEIRQRILDHKPTVVVMYGEIRKPYWESLPTEYVGRRTDSSTQETMRIDVMYSTPFYRTGTTRSPTRLPEIEKVEWQSRTRNSRSDSLVGQEARLCHFGLRPKAAYDCENEKQFNLPQWKESK